MYTEGKADEIVILEAKIVLKLTFTGIDSLSFPFNLQRQLSFKA